MSRPSTFDESANRTAIINGQSMVCSSKTLTLTERFEFDSDVAPIADLKAANCTAVQSKGCGKEPPGKNNYLAMDPESNDKSECNAYKVEYRCLMGLIETAQGKCATAISDELERIGRKQREHHCEQ